MKRQKGGGVTNLDNISKFSVVLFGEPSLIALHQRVARAATGLGGVTMGQLPAPPKQPSHYNSQPAGRTYLANSNLGSFYQAVLPAYTDLPESKEF